MVYFFIDLTVKLSLCLSHGKGGGEKDAAVIWAYCWMPNHIPSN